MINPKYITIFKNDTITLSFGHDGYWLYDYTRGMNLSMKAKTEQDALIESLMYYQKRLTKVESELKDITNKVENFISQFSKEEN